MSITCYFQGCIKKGETREHIPPKAFFPEDQREQLLTVKSCREHNNEKSTDDEYILAHICLNSSPVNNSKEVFIRSVMPQLGYNEGAFRKKLIEGSIKHKDGTVSYKVDVRRFDDFFKALSCGIIYKSCGKSLPSEYSINHIYHNLIDNYMSNEEKMLTEMISSFYEDIEEADIMKFGHLKTLNSSIYSVKIYGLSDFQSSITIIHEFYGQFRVTSMLSRIFP